MLKVYIFALKSMRKIYRTFFASKLKEYDRGISDPNKASDIIFELLSSGKPCMIARFGSTELLAITNYLGVCEPQRSVWEYIQGKQFEWWWEEHIKEQMTQWSGFFPSTNKNLTKFGKLFIEDCKQIDILGSWLENETTIINRIELNVQKISLLFLEPYWSENPWSRILEGKNVLVIHPFAPLIEEQYSGKRALLFNNKNVLPKFNLKTIQAVQSLGGDCEFNDWFEALDNMKAQMDQTDYDIALIGCGAYGFPLAAHAKRMGKQAIHLGGALQLLFGIRGKRWDNPDYGIQEFGKQNTYKKLFNKEWIYPPADFAPKNAQKVENACYW